MAVEAAEEVGFGTFVGDVSEAADALNLASASGCWNLTTDVA